MLELSERYKLTGIIMKMAEGRFDLDDLYELVKYLKIRRAEHISIINSYIDRLNRSSDFNYNLLLMAISGNTALEILEEAGDSLQYIPQLYKAVAIYGLLYDRPQTLNPSLLLRTLIAPHKYTSLYNPLVILYAHRRAPELVSRSLLSALEKKTIQYRVNPSTVRIIVFRDLLLYAAMTREPVIADTLYAEVDTAGFVSKAFREKSPHILLGEYALITRSFLEVLSSTILLYRLAITAVQDCLGEKYRIQGKISGESFVGRVIEWYIDAGCSLLEQSLRKTYTALLSLTGAIIPRVHKAIAESLDTLLGMDAALRESLIPMIGAAVETRSLLGKWGELRGTAIDYLEGIHPPDETVKVLEKFLGIVEEHLSRNRVLVRDILSSGGLFAEALRERLRRITMGTGGLPWIPQQ